MLETPLGLQERSGSAGVGPIVAKRAARTDQYWSELTTSPPARVASFW